MTTTRRNETIRMYCPQCGAVNVVAAREDDRWRPAAIDCDVCGYASDFSPGWGDVDMDMARATQARNDLYRELDTLVEEWTRKMRQLVAEQVGAMIRAKDER